MNTAELIGLDPTSVRTGKQGRKAAKRPASLDGAVVGLVINGLGRAEDLMHAIYTELAKEVRLGGCVAIVKPDISVGPPPADFERLVTQATVAITGFGGCGSCSTRSMRDAMELEWAGVPSVALIHEAVNIGVKMLVKIAGMEDYPYVLLGAPYPNLCEWTDAEVAEVAKLVAPQILKLLSPAETAVHAPLLQTA